MPYVYYTGTRSIWIEEHLPRGTPADAPKKRVLINGGANLANKLFETPRGVATRVTDDELEFLKGHHHFKDMVKKGFASYDSKQIDIEKVVKDLEAKDGSAPLTAKEGQALADQSAAELGENSKGTLKLNKG